MNNLRVETRYYTPELLALGMWLTEEEHRRMNTVIVCGQPESPDLDPLDSDLPDYETMMAKDPLSLSNVECIPATSKHEVKDDHNLSVSTTSNSLTDSESSETTDTNSSTSYTEDDTEDSSNGYIYTSTPLGNYGNYMLAPYVATSTRSRKRIRGRRLNFDDLSSIGDPMEISVDEEESAEPKAKRVAVAECIKDMEKFTN